MSDYIITTDNNADLPESYYQEHGIGCGYFSYTIDDVVYTADNFLPTQEFYQKMRNGSMPTTSQVNPEDAAALMEPYLQKGYDVVHISFSSGLSGSFNSCRIAAEDLREQYPERKIMIIDSLAASLGQGLLVHLAVKKKQEGMSFDELVSWLEENKQSIVHLFTVDDLNHLFRGGRVSRTTAIVGGMLNIKPVLHVDNDGKLVPTGKVRGRKKSLLMLIDNMEKQIGSYRDSLDTVFISHGDCLEDAQFLAEKVKERFHVEVEMINYVGAVIGAHSGPGTVALFFQGETR